MSIIAEKAGAVNVRVGGNTQETAFVVGSLADGKMIEKDKEDASNPVGFIETHRTTAPPLTPHERRPQLPFSHLHPI